MSLEDYISGRKFAQPHWIKLYSDIDTYDIQEDKLELIKSLRNYLTLYKYYADLNQLLGHDVTFIQLESTTNHRMAARIPLQKYEFDSYYNEHTVQISNQEYLERINTYKRAGVQRLTDAFISNPFTTHVVIHIYYSKDGHIFVNDEDAEAINEMNIDRLGESLANEVKAHQKYDIVAKNKHENYVNDELRKKYEKGKIPLYTYSNEQLYLDGKALKLGFKY